MNTISTIVGPSITLWWPLVGGSLASSDWVRFSKFIEPAAPTMYHRKRGGIQPLSFLSILVICLYVYV